MRYRDTSLLAVGKFVYVGDDRFRVIHEPHTAEWYLAIKSVSYADQGVYECQINSKGGESRKQKSRLTVVGKSILSHPINQHQLRFRVVGLRAVGLVPSDASTHYVLHTFRIIDAETLLDVAIYRGYRSLAAGLSLRAPPSLPWLIVSALLFLRVRRSSSHVYCSTFGRQRGL